MSKDDRCSVFLTCSCNPAAACFTCFECFFKHPQNLGITSNPISQTWVRERAANDESDETLCSAHDREHIHTCAGAPFRGEIPQKLQIEGVCVPLFFFVRVRQGNL